MEAKAILNNVRISPRKVTIVMDLIRGKDYDMAMGILKNTHKSASEYMIKLLASAKANVISKAEAHDQVVDEAKLYVSECFVTPGPTLKRGQARGRGGFDRLLKRTSHMTIVVSEKQ